MSCSNLADFSRLLLTIYHSAQGLPAHQFQGAALEAAKPALSDPRFLSALAPHLAQASAINRQIHLDRMLGDAARDHWAIAIADKRGFLYRADSRFRELVQSEWPLPSDERLPSALIDELGRHDNRLVGARLVVHRSLEQGLYLLRARQRHKVDRLSHRELMVGQLLATGMTQKQIAARVARSPETIRSQVKSIFAKLEINNVALLPPLLVLRQ
jgi:DNA-binding CsgD family transcriptional regulator